MPDVLAMPKGVLGGKITFTVTFYGTESADTPVDPDNYATVSEPYVRILDSLGLPVAGPYDKSTTPAVTRTAQGKYSFPFTIPGAWTAGDNYRIQWQLTIGSNNCTFEQQFAIETTRIDITQFGYAATGHAKTLIQDYLYPFLGESMDLEVHSEIAQRLSSTKLRFNHPHWREDWTPVLYKNENTFLTYGTDYTVEFDTGMVTMTTALTAGDDIDATYRFMYFTIQELNSYLELTLRGMNGIKPASAYGMDSAPMEWDEAIVMGAQIKAIERMLFDRQIWRDILIWADAPGAREALQGLYSSLTARFSVLTDPRHFKRRGAVSPLGVTSGKYYTPQLVDNINFRRYTVIGGSF